MDKTKFPRYVLEEGIIEELNDGDTNRCWYISEMINHENGNWGYERCKDIPPFETEESAKAWIDENGKDEKVTIEIEDD